MARRRRGAQALPRYWTLKAFIGKFGFWIDADVAPVQDIGESVAMGMAAVAWTQAALKS